MLEVSVAIILANVILLGKVIILSITFIPFTELITTSYVAGLLTVILILPVAP